MKRFLLLFVILLVGCTQTVEQITNEEHIGKIVAVKGTVENTIKIGSLSGYTLEDKNGIKIMVSSERLPADGDTVTAKGTLRRGPLGFYIET